MITSAQIARFRGIRELVVSGFGRVNLIIGKNDCGKTALMEALQIGDDVADAAHHLYADQRDRLGRRTPVRHFDRFWRPLFYNLNSKLGFSISVANEQPGWKTLEVRQGVAPDEILSPAAASEELVEDDEGPNDQPGWSLELALSTEIDNRSSVQKIIATSRSVRLPPASRADGSYWIRSGTSINSEDLRLISVLKQNGREEVMLDLLRKVNDRLLAIELLAPGGSKAELFVRLDKETPMLPLALMGEGFQRCLEIGAGAAANDRPTLFIDEIENGMHHLVLEPLWKWLGEVSREHDLQVFATTHSEECIYAACRAFAALDDDGLRVIRLDRLESGTRAAVYDRGLVETAARTGTEIRG